jgi:outer membrane receptor protein involved in Fe transport
MAGSFVRKSARLLAWTLLFSLASAGVAAAQPARGGAVSGTVSSDDGAPLAGAAVVLRGAGQERAARTDAAGRFTATGLAAGVYSIRVSAPGFNALSDRTVGVAASETTTVTLALARSSTSLITIGHTQTGASNTLSTSSAPTATIDAQDYAAQGYTRVSDVLQNEISTTLVHPLGGSGALPTSVALRGPDPTETLVDIDGHQVNNGNTGDFDLSLLDPADYANIELVKGISPSSLVGPDTIDGAINIRTLEPTTNPHGLLRLSAGSYNSFAETLQATGSDDRLGYALSLHRTTSAGETNQVVADATNGGAPAFVGSALDGATALGKLRYAFGSAGQAYAELSFRDQSQRRDLSAALSTLAVAAPGAAGTLPLVNGFEGTSLLAHNAGYGIDIRTPLGAPGPSGIAPTNLLFRHYTSFVSQSVDGPGADTSPYLYNDRDRVDDETLEIDRQFSNSTLTLQYDVRNEVLATDFESGGANVEARLRRQAWSATRLLDAAATPANAQLVLGQTQRSAALRYTYDPTASVHLTAAAYYSRYSIFGSNVDPRFGAVYTPDPRSVIRFSLGTTYQAPQLPELYVPAVLPVVVGNAISIGNPNLQPDHATEYGLGFERVLAAGERRSTLSIDLYRVNLRAPSVALQPSVDPSCGPVAAGGDGTPCPLTYPVNAGDAIYQGIELGAERRLAPFTTARAGYAVRSAYLTNVPPAVQDGSLVIGEQTLGLPLHKATLDVTHAPPAGWSYFGGLVYEGAYNELNQPPFATLSGGIGYRLRSLEFALSGSNLTNVYDRHFTAPGAGVPYDGLTGPLATDAYALQGASFNFGVSRRF